MNRKHETSRKIVKIGPPPGVKPSGFTMLNYILPSEEEISVKRAERKRLEKEGKLPPLIWEPKPED